jgi:hypothetical protein
MEVIEEEPGPPARGVGRRADEEVFEQGEAVFAKVDGVYAHYR